MATIPPWATGRHWTVLTVQPLQADASGVLTTNGSALSFLGILDGFRYSGEDTTEQINAIGATVDNEVSLERDDSWTLTEIMRRGQNQSNLAALWENTGRTEYAKIVYTRSGNTITAYVHMDSVTERIERGKCTAEMAFSFVDAGGDVTVNPQYS